LIDTFQFNRLVNVSFKEKKKYLIVVIIYDLIYYIPVLIYIDLIETNSTNYNSTIIITKTCIYRKAEQLMIVSVMDTINRVLPFSLMFASSLLLIYCLFKSRTRIVENFLAEENKTFYTEIRLATVSISLNLIFLFLNIPYCIVRLFPRFSNPNIFSL